MAKRERMEFLISSPTYITGMISTKDLLILPVEGSFSSQGKWRNYYTIRLYDDFSTKRQTSNYRSIYWTAIENLCSIFSLFFGKRFDLHWFLRDNYNNQYLPETWNSSIKDQWLTTNNKKKRIDSFWYRENDSSDLHRMNILPFLKTLSRIKHSKKTNFLEASYFYRQGLINIDYSIEIGYFDLIRAIEVLWGTNNGKYIKWDFSPELEEMYEIIKEKDKHLAKRFKDTHWSTKKFCITIVKLLKGSDIWEKSESTIDRLSIKSIVEEKDRTDLIKNAYNIRSKYVHSWLNFWRYIKPYYDTQYPENKDWIAELVNFWPWGSRKDNPIQIGKTLSFAGLERIIRGTLINYIIKK